jgi:MATE family multidrug resistance protein
VFDNDGFAAHDNRPMEFAKEIKTILRLALPLMIGQLSQMLLAVADTIMVGALGVTELAALTFVNSLFWVPLVFGIGFLTSVSVRSSNALGARDPQAARQSCRYGLLVSLALGIVLFLLSFLLLALMLPYFGQAENINKLTSPYFLVIMASGIPCLASLALKNHADALNRPWPPFWIFLGGVVLNVLLNALLIHGFWVLPPLGMMGAAWATLISRMAILMVMLLWLTNDAALKDWVPRRWLKMIRRKDLTNHGKIGIPASLQMLCEVVAFSSAGIMMGWLGEVPLAAHQVAITCAGVAFMVPLGLSMALTVRVGECFGARDFTAMRNVIYCGWALAVTLGLLNAIVFYTMGNKIADCFTSNQEVVKLTARLFGIVGVFQIVDGLQVASASMLRGMHDTKISALLGFFAYWVCGIPLAYFMGKAENFGAQGIWWSLAGGLLVACIGLGIRLKMQQNNVHCGG